ncbi:glycoside hydrolase family 130 protein [Sunxiuqinia sp. A32]|uniref:glycoside hydrolase family 130 protein n=1 Tax=Sunxiuqinia sp. A32 TaxID=3461496 RepID=UPI00404606EE
MCPIRDTLVNWEQKDVFNPASVVKGDTLFLLYRAEDVIGEYKGTSRIGLAYSLDGYSFEKLETPVLFPNNDECIKYEWEGGCEDPRIVEDSDGTYYMTYTAYDGDKARLFVATSIDLRKWQKYGSVFKKAGDEYVDMWSKSGSIVCRHVDGKMVATKVNGKYWMYWGESNIYVATSNNLIDWNPILETDPGKMHLDTMRAYTKAFHIVFSTREDMFDSELVEPGPPALITDDGILFLYNSKNSKTNGDKNLAAGAYAAGQVLIDKNDPTKVVDRMDRWFITPDQPYEIGGQVNNVCFLEGLAYFNNKWLLYYGTADSKIAVAESTAKLAL